MSQSGSNVWDILQKSSIVAKVGFKTAPNGPRMAKDGPKMAEDHPTMAQRFGIVAKIGFKIGTRWP